MASTLLSSAATSRNCLNSSLLDPTGRTKDFASTSSAITRAHKETEPSWFVLRDLKRANARVTGYDLLLSAGQAVFTPLKTVIQTTSAGKQRRQVPVIPDLLFVRALRSQLDPLIQAIPTLQYRWLRGAPFQTPMTVDKRSMERFIAAVTATEPTRYYSPGEITPDMYGKHVRIVGGPLDGHEGRLLKLKGLRKRHLLIELPNYLTAAIEVAPEFIQLLD